jgi:hypothetical protein
MASATATCLTSASWRPPIPNRFLIAQVYIFRFVLPHPTAFPEIVEPLLTECRAVAPSTPLTKTRPWGPRVLRSRRLEGIDFGLFHFGKRSSVKNKATVPGLAQPGPEAPRYPGTPAPHWRPGLVQERAVRNYSAINFRSAHSILLPTSTVLHLSIWPRVWRRRKLISRKQRIGCLVG